MNEPSAPVPPRLTWPKYVIAAVLLFVFVCVMWTLREVKRLQRAKDASKDLRPRSAAPAVPGSGQTWPTG